jgi:murein L,D-transpeptidase YcbB/YkuD
MMRVIALGLLVAAAVSLPSYAAEPDGPPSLINEKEALRIGVQSRLAAKPGDTAARKAQKDALIKYYLVPEQPLLWVGENGLTERAKQVMAEIGKADDYGLTASDYSLPNPAGFNASDPKSRDWLADAEVKVSYAVLDYAKDARGGRIEPLRLSKNLDPALALPNPSEVLESIAIRSDPAAYLRSFQPDQSQFEALRQKLLELRGGKVEEPKPNVVIIPEGPVLKFGTQHEQVALLRKRLDVPAGSDETKYDEAVLEAVRQFQSSHGAYADGMVGPGTRRMLNGGQRQQQAVSNPARINQILVNMERWRWLPHDLGPVYVTVNIPEFTLRVVEEGTPIHTARVVVGKPDKQTPVISDEMEEVVFNPYWNVPNSIKNEEIAPYMGYGGGFFGGGWDTSVLKRHGLRIKYGNRDIDPDQIDWSRNDIRNFDLVQPPGPGNVLGRVKFVFPNKHDVYMHDTTQKHLFANTVRAESHGCMRVQNPERFAEILLGRDKGWSPARVESTFGAGDDYHVALDQKIPVYVTYFTLRVNDDGSFTTFNDIYRHDARMNAALNGKGSVPDPWAQDEEMAVNQDWGTVLNKRYRVRPGRNSNDFTRTLFRF